MRLNALERLAFFVADADVSLFSALRKGAPTGCQYDIPDSHPFWTNDVEQLHDVPLSLHLQNWRSAAVDTPTTLALLQEEIDQGFCF